MLNISLEEFIKKYERAAYKVALSSTFRFRNYYYFDFDDILSEAKLELIRVYNTYEESKGNLNTHVFSSIKYRMQKVQRDLNRNFRFSRTVKEISIHIDETYTIPRIMKEFNCKYIVAQSVIAYKYGKSFSNDSHDNEDEDCSYFIGEWDSYESIYFNDFYDILDEREKIIVKLRLDGLIQRQIAEKLGISQNNVSRILKKVREKFNKSYLLTS